MPTDPANRLIDHIFRCMLPGDGDEQADGELLSRFIEQHDGEALAAIVRRHAGMVWGVCNRALQSQQDAEDAFQSTFLVLVRKATSIVPRGNVGNWLYGVANQVTTHAKRGIARRRRREVQVIEMPDTLAQPGLSLDLRFVLDEELVRLPDIYRAVGVLCDLEGRTRREVARLLGVPDGTVGGRLARARALLAERLTRRGVVFSSGSMAAALSAGTASASVPPALVASTIMAASLLAAGQTAGVVSAKVAALTEGVVKAMSVYKLKAALSAVLLLGLLAAGATALHYGAAAAQEDRKPVAEKTVEAPAKPEKKQEPVVFWGKEVDGLQAGLSLVEAKTVRGGDTTRLEVKLEVKIRNVDPTLSRHGEPPTVIVHR
jgi:RNA polymerase sigma factor (sigma-70 family)